MTRRRFILPLDCVGIAFRVLARAFPFARPNARMYECTCISSSCDGSVVVVVGRWIVLSYGTGPMDEGEGWDGVDGSSSCFRRGPFVPLL